MPIDSRWEKLSMLERRQRLKQIGEKKLREVSADDVAYLLWEITWWKRMAREISIRYRGGEDG